MIDFMTQIDVELTDAGELVYQQGLVDPPQAQTITAAGEQPVASSGPVASLSDSLAGFWIVDVASEARAIQFAWKITSMTEAPAEVRQCAEGATRALNTRRPLAGPSS